jgi:spore maturation protein CgeB
VTDRPLNCVFLGLTITSTWGNGHATTYRGLLKELSKRGHSVSFLERDVPWYAGNREFSEAPYCRIELYQSLAELKERYSGLVREADVVVVGSYVPEGIAVGDWVTSVARGCTAFYDIDTPVTLANLKADSCEYLSYGLIPKYQVYFSFTGGPLLDHIQQQLGSPCARPLYCSVDPSLYFPEGRQNTWDLAYIGTYAQDRQPALEKLLLSVASEMPGWKFAIAGPQYPADTLWPANVQRIEHLPATQHRSFYNAQRFTLNLTRRDMIAAGYSPSVRLFEAAACGTPILTDQWAGLSNFFELFTEIVPVSTAEDVTSYIQMPDEQRLEIADQARRRTLRFHTAAVRAQEFELQIEKSLERASYLKRQSKVTLRRTPTAALI